MYSWKDYVRATITLIGVMAFLTAFLTLNGLHYAGAL
tara:strand:+ start:5704 stop:5814 length:111 start_codon:yes stop_codon:yes gene_type:complete